MKAIVITRFGGPEVLEVRDVPSPTPGRGEVRVRVRATAVNRADLLQRMGAYPAPPDAPQDVPGLEYAGEIDALGEGVTGWRLGDRVFGLCGGGSYAEHLVAPARALARIPDPLSFTDAAAVPEAFITAWDAMVTQAHLAAGETVLVSAVGSGVGCAAVQLARAIGARSVGTARTADKLERARALGLDLGVVPGGGRFATHVGAPDVILELVGGGYLAEDLACIAPRGRLVLVGLMAGARAELDLGLVLKARRAHRHRAPLAPARGEDRGHAGLRASRRAAPVTRPRRADRRPRAAPRRGRRRPRIRRLQSELRQGRARDPLITRAPGSAPRGSANHDTAGARRRGATSPSRPRPSARSPQNAGAG